MKTKAIAALIFTVLFSCNNTTSPTENKNSPVGLWQESDRGMLSGYADSVTFRDQVNITDSIFTYKLYIDSNLNKGFIGRWSLLHDTIRVQISSCFSTESEQRVNCQWTFPTPPNAIVSPDTTSINYFWDGKNIMGSKSPLLFVYSRE